MAARSSGEIRSSQYRGGIFVDRKQGYDREYRIKDGHLFDLALNCPLDPSGIHVGTALRLESRPNAGDASVVYAILDQKTLSKGLLIDVFDIFDEICDRGLAERLVENRCTEFVEDRDGPLRPTQGLQERVRPRSRALCIAHRIYGESFSVLGFDTAAQTNSLLVTSIHRD